MKAALSRLSLERPATLAHALRLLADSCRSERLTPIAGGTDLYVYLNAGSLTATRFFDLSGIPALRGLRVTPGGVLRMGALTTFRELGAHAKVAAGWPSLAAAARVIGAAQIQNRATVGGNVANASPAGDSLPVLLAHDALVRVASVRGEREIAFASLHTGYRRLALEPDELIVSFELPPAPRGAPAFFRKVGTRAAQSISKVVFAGLLHAGRASAPDLVRLAWGSVAPVPVRAAGAEAALLASPPSRAAAAAALAALDRDIAPIDDIRSDREYRSAVARNLLAQFLRTAHPGYSRG
ncbi:MAG: FAD binding domain-containing protein [Candidatus Eisenbacteria bacterium]|nr:FAD binding domain-containing protein [Candidatus Eisenbacteria bacterium]